MRLLGATPTKLTEEHDDNAGKLEDPWGFRQLEHAHGLEHGCSARRYIRRNHRRHQLLHGHVDDTAGQRQFDYGQRLQRNPGDSRPRGTDAVTAGLSSSGTVDVDATGTGGTSLTVGSTFTNQGILVIGNSGITKASTLTALTLVNAGTIDLTGGTTALATLDITGATPTTLVGTYVLQGNALLEVPSSVSPSGGSVTAIASNTKLILDGAQTRGHRAPPPQPTAG